MHPGSTPVAQPARLGASAAEDTQQSPAQASCACTPGRTPVAQPASSEAPLSRAYVLTLTQLVLLRDGHRYLCKSFLHGGMMECLDLLPNVVGSLDTTSLQAQGTKGTHIQVAGCAKGKRQKAKGKRPLRWKPW